MTFPFLEQLFCRVIHNHTTHPLRGNESVLFSGFRVVQSSRLQFCHPGKKPRTPPVIPPALSLLWETPNHLACACALWLPQVIGVSRVLSGPASLSGTCPGRVPEPTPPAARRACVSPPPGVADVGADVHVSLRRAPPQWDGRVAGHTGLASSVTSKKSLPHPGSAVSARCLRAAALAAVSVWWTLTCRIQFTVCRGKVRRRSSQAAGSRPLRREPADRRARFSSGFRVWAVARIVVQRQLHTDLPPRPHAKLRSRDVLGSDRGLPGRLLGLGSLARPRGC